MTDGGSALLVLLPIAFYGVLRTVKDVRNAWIHRQEHSPVHRLGRIRLAAWLSSWVCAGLMVADALLRGPGWIFVMAFAGVGFAWVSYLALSLFWGALGGPEN